MSHVLPSLLPSPPPVPGGTARAVVREVGLRDGLQSIATVLTAARKFEWIDAPSAAGQRETEVGPFVHTEDLACMLERMGAHAGRDMPALLALPQRVAGWLAGGYPAWHAMADRVAPGASGCCGQRAGCLGFVVPLNPLS